MIDKETEVQVPERYGLTTFAVAHMLESLKNLRGTATDGLRLADYLQV